MKTVDLRASLPRRQRVVGLRELSEIGLVVVHCDGRDREPGDDDLAVLKEHAQFHIDKNWGSTAQPAYGDGLMYHFAVTSRAIYETRDLHEVTWHARGANRSGLAIVLPCGFDQAPTAGQIRNLLALLDWLINGRDDLQLEYKDVWGHGELTQYGNDTPCPGASLREWVQNYRRNGPPDDDFPIEGPPTITPEVFSAQLERRKSPALGEASGAYYFDLIASYGLDPAIALAFFGKESEFGSYEHSAVDRTAMAGAKNWGNLRPNPDLNQPPGGRATRRIDSGRYGPFRGYERWEDGLRDWCEKMLSATYRGKPLLGVLNVYAPQSDGNEPAAYAATVHQWVGGWRAQSVDLPRAA